MQRLSVHASRRTGAVVPAALLGHNLELALGSSESLLTDRLRNPKFLGPADAQTGIVPGWQPPNANYAGISYAWKAGEGIEGSGAQLVLSVSNRAGKGLVQPGCWIRRGERLAVELWARAIHDPVTIRVGVRPAAVWAEAYAAAEVQVASACWQPYNLELTVPVDDDTAAFFIWVDQPGVLALDQVHLRPAGGGIVRRDVLARMGEFGIPLLRFPGGCVTTAYHWRFGTGPHYRRPILPDPVFNHELIYDFGTDELLAFCHEYGVTPVMTVNIGTGTPDEASEWAAYCADWYRCRRLPLPPMYWQLGNEPYGWWERSHMTGEMYAATVRELAPGIRKAYPGARLVALGMAEGYALNNGMYPWRGPLLDAVAADCDVLALQLYAVLAPQADPAAQQAAVLGAVVRNAQTLADAVTDCRARGLPTTVALSEWNLWLHASHFAPEGFVEPMDLQHGLYAAGMFHRFAQLAPDMEFAAMYQIVGCMNTLAVMRDQVRDTVVAEVFRLYRPALPGRRVELAVVSPELAPGVAAVEAMAFTRGRRTWAFLVNRSLDRVFSVDLEGLPAFAGGVTLAGDTPLDNTVRSGPARRRGARVELPPLSITRLECA